MKMKKAALATKYKSSILRSVSKISSYPFSVSTVTDKLQSSLKDFADIENPQKIIKDSDPSIIVLVQAINRNTQSVESMTRAYQTALGKVADLEKNIAQMVAEGAAYRLAAKRTKPADKSKVIFLSSDGDLYREPKIKHCYPMGKEKQRQKMVRILIEQKAFVSTDSLVELTGSKSRKAKLMINDKTKYHLGISNFIVGRSVSGYKINPEYKIKLV
ncbi:MAG TPA: hypothetical protein DEF59_01685 [Candidatus Magasanikbacteria bacterium]|nr:hypothetical protein [Candidatus Magasanikbacteria bacterium]